jgi:hypothetical protein
MITSSFVPNAANGSVDVDVVRPAHFPAPMAPIDATGSS